MSPDEFDALFDSFRHTVIRLETLPEFRVAGAEAERLSAARDGRARPERSVRTSAWLARIAMTTVEQHKSWERVRIVDDPLTWYQRQELEAYRESQAVGERIGLVRRADVVDHLVGVEDFWLFDRATPARFMVAMHYDAEGRWLGAELIRDDERLDRAERLIEVCSAPAVSLNSFLIGVRA